jgi:hypothetical protein
MSAFVHKPPSTQADRRTFLFIHAAYHGGWCWQPVTDILEWHRHKTYTPSLTGNADRSHLLSKEVNLDTQISDIANLVMWEDLHDVCLVAHSFGSWPASGALERIYDRVASIVWIDAFKPKNGERAVDCISGFAREALEKAIARDEAGGQPPPAKTYSVSEKHYAWIDSKVTPQPNGVFVQPIKLTGKLEQIAKKIYVRMPKFPHAQFDKALAECTADKTWQIFVNDNSGHDVMIDQPDWLADLLLRVS